MDCPRPVDTEVLVELDGPAPIRWSGDVVPASRIGPLCTQHPDRLTIWAPGPTWAYAFRLIAMCRSALPERCLVLTDVELSPDAVPSDTWAAAVGRRQRAAYRGSATYVSADLRSERIFRLLLSERAWRRPELQTLLDRHALLATPHGARLLERWHAVALPLLFAAGQPRRMGEGLRLALVELADAATAAERSVIGGFHALDEVVRDPSEWEAGARTYLPLAASHSPEALVAVKRWLDFTPAWARAPMQLARARREAAAAALHRLADDPWLPGHEVVEVLAKGDAT
jgi:hypothetical protein